MITVILLVLAIAVGAYMIYKGYQKEGEFTPKAAAPGLITGIVLLIVAIFQPFRLDRVDAGHVGIKVNLAGDNRGVGRYEYKTGWFVYNTWFSTFLEFPTFQKNIKYEKQPVICKGGFSAEIAPTFTYATKPGNVGDMFANLRVGMDQIEEGWLHTVVVSSINDVTNRWTVDDIFNNREKFEGDITHEVNKRVGKWFTLTQLRTNITPPKELQEAIVSKTRAIQEVQVAEQQRLVAIAQGEKAVAQARAKGDAQIVASRADSAAAVIAAAGEAEAIRRKQVTLSSTYIDYLKVQKWDGVMPTVQGSGGLIIDLKKK